MTQQLKLNSIGFALKKSQLFLQVCLQPLNKTDHWPIDTIGRSDITRNLSQKLIRRDRGKSSLEVEESKKTDFYHGETRTESLVENLEVKLGSLNDVGKDMDLKRSGLMEASQVQVDRDLDGKWQYRGIGNMVGLTIWV